MSSNLLEQEFTWTAGGLEGEELKKARADIEGHEEEIQKAAFARMEEFFSARVNEESTPEQVEQALAEFLEDVGRSEYLGVVGEQLERAQAELLAKINETLESLGLELLDPSVEFQLSFALAELHKNAAMHGNKRDPEGKVVTGLRVVLDKTSTKVQATISIQDDGAGFDLAKVADCTDGDHLDIPTGRGIETTRNMVDNLEYKHPGNVATFQKGVGEREEPAV